MSFFNMDSSLDIGIDLGTANTLIYLRGNGLVLNEPSILACERDTGNVLAFGDEALAMHEKLHYGIITIKPISRGVITDYASIIKLTKAFLHKVKKNYFFGIHRLVISIPLGITEVGKKAVFDVAEHLNAKETFLIAEPIATAIGIGLNPFEAAGNMIVNIGAGTTEIAVLSLGGIVTGESLPVAGNDVNDRIFRSIRDSYNVVVSDHVIEKIKIDIVSHDKDVSIGVGGLNIETGLPEILDIESSIIRKAMSIPIAQMISSLKRHIESLVNKPDLAVDILKHGIYLTGGGALTYGLDEKVENETNISVNLPDDPLTSVIMGIGTILDDIKKYRPLLATNARKKKWSSDAESTFAGLKAELNKESNSDDFDSEPTREAL